MQLLDEGQTPVSPRFRADSVYTLGSSAPAVSSSVVTYDQHPFSKWSRIKDTDWKVKIDRMQDASHAYYRRDISWIPVGSNFDCRSDWSGTPCTERGKFYLAQDLGYPAIVTDQEDAALKDLALARLKRKLATSAKQWNTLVPAVELREFRKMITALTFSATDLMYTLLSIKKKYGREQAAKFAAHSILTWNFAIKPLLGEIQSAQNAVHESLFGEPKKATDFGAARKVWTSSHGPYQRAVGRYATATYRLDIKHMLSYRYVAGYTLPVRSANDYSEKDRYGINLGSMVPALWELTPYSWVVDYFTTTGAYLDDVFTSDGVNTIYVNCFSKYVAEGFYTVTGVTTPTRSLSSSFSPTGSRFKWATRRREVLGSLPTRSLRFKTADEIGKNAMTKLLNLGSVLIGRSLKHGARPLSTKY